MREDLRGGVDAAGGKSSSLGHLLRNVGIRDVLVALGRASAEEPVGLVEAAHRRERPGRLKLRLKRRHLGLGDQLVAAHGSIRDHRDGDPLADLDLRPLEDAAVRIAEGQHEHVRESEAVVDEGGDEQRGDVIGERLVVDLDVERVARLLIRHGSLYRYWSASVGAGTRRRVPGESRMGSSMWFTSAMARHSAGSSYSR